jgi:hypothetical protein
VAIKEYHKISSAIRKSTFLYDEERFENQTLENIEKKSGQ